MRAVPLNSETVKQLQAFPVPSDRGNHHKSCMAYSPVLAFHHREDVLLSIQTSALYGIEIKVIHTNIVPGMQGVELPTHPLYMWGNREIVHTMRAQSLFQKNLKLPRAKERMNALNAQNENKEIKEIAYILF